MDYSKFLAKKVQEMKPSGIRKFFDMLEGRKGVISLTIGQPDFVTPWHIREAGIESISGGHTYYTSNKGTKTLLYEIAKYMSRRCGLEYDPATEILATVGASEAIDLAIRAMVEPGDEVIVPLPCFVCYQPLIRMADGVPVEIVTTEAEGFKITPEKLRAAITPKTKMVILPYPSNPTGVILTESELKEIADIIIENDLIVLSDEIYAELTYTGKHVSIATLPGMKERTVIVNGFSKAYAMTGWRLGFSLAPAPITDAMFKIHQYGVMCASTASQYAAIEALRNGDADIETMREQYDIRRRYLVSALNEIGLPCTSPEGAFYVFPRIDILGLSSEEFCSKLLEETNVAIVPGTAFGDCGEGYARLSYAYSLEHIKEAVSRIRYFIEKHKIMDNID